MRTKIKKLLSLNDSPEQIALAFSVGVFITFTPFYGFHTIIAIMVILLLKLNKFAVLIGSTLNLPWFSPAVYFFCYFVGSQIWTLFPSLNAYPLFRAKDFSFFFSSWSNFMTIFETSHFLRIFLPTLIGTTLVGILCAFLSFFVIKHAIHKFRKKRTCKNVKKIGEVDQTESELPEETELHVVNEV